jgi:hypothetical protein
MKRTVERYQIVLRQPDIERPAILANVTSILCLRDGDDSIPPDHPCERHLGRGGLVPGLQFVATPDRPAAVFARWENRP